MANASDFTKEMLIIDESMREIASLSELYEELLKTIPKNRHEAESIREQAEFARDRILKLSLNVKHKLDKAESHEHV